MTGSIIYDGKATPGDIWNNEINICRIYLHLGYNQNNLLTVSRVGRSFKNVKIQL
jgi:hypothetical protein